MGDYFPIVMGGILSLIGLVSAALLDFFKREPRFMHQAYSRADSHRMSYLFIGAVLADWTAVALMRYGMMVPEMGWPLFGLIYAGRIVLLQRDFTKRRIDVPNRILRITQYEFVGVAVLLVGISYYVHSRP